MVDPVTATSTFLTSPAGQGLTAAAGGILGSQFGSPSRAKQARQRRDQYADQKKYGSKVLDKQLRINEKYRNREIQGRVADARAAGLHPLAALGIAPSSGGSIPGFSSSDIPGQHQTGSAIESGIRTLQGAQRHESQTAHQQVMAGLQLEEQTLRNDWLKTQILNSESKRAAAAANSQQFDPAMRPRPLTKPHPAEAQRRTYMNKDGGTYSVIGGTSAEGLEADVGEWADYMPETLHRAYEVFRSQLRNYGGVDPANTWWHRQMHPKPPQNRKSVIGKSRHGPRSRR